MRCCRLLFVVGRLMLVAVCCFMYVVCVRCASLLVGCWLLSVDCGLFICVFRCLSHVICYCLFLSVGFRLWFVVCCCVLCDGCCFVCLLLRAWLFFGVRVVCCLL